MEEAFSRTINLLGDDSFLLLTGKKVLVVGLGGVGAAAAEALVRTGIGTIGVCDSDCVSESNLNRQLIALHSTVGRKKTEVFAERARDVSPKVTIVRYDFFLNEETLPSLSIADYDYVVDAIDTITSKLLLAMECQRLGVAEICCLSTGNKLHPELLKVADVFSTSVCPIARVMRKELRERGITKLKVVYSEETPISPQHTAEEHGRHIPASSPFVPPAAGYILAAETVRDLLGK